MDWEDPSAICILRHKPVTQGLSERASKSVNNSTDDVPAQKKARPEFGQMVCISRVHREAMRQYAERQFVGRRKKKIALFIYLFTVIHQGSQQ